MDQSGSAHNGTSHNGTTDVSAQLRVIRKLLSRAESTDFPSERDACLAKVADLVARYSIEDALVWADRDDERRELPVERILVVPDPYAARKVMLFGTVGRHNRCTVIDLGADAARARRVSVIGFRGDVDRVEVLVTSLLLQLTRGMLADNPRTTGSATAAWRRSFITGFAVRVGERMAEAQRRNEAGARAEASGPGGPAPSGASVALVLADRADAVNAAVRQRYPYLRTTRIDAGSSPHGRAAGRAAGDRATLGGGEVRGRRRALGA